MTDQAVETPPEEADLKTEIEAPPAPEAPASPTREQVEETNRILKDVQEKLGRAPGAPSGPTQDQMREMIREKTGLSDAGIDWVMQMNRDAVMGAVAPVASDLAWMKMKSAKASTSFPISEEVEKEMTEELKTYPPASKGDPVLLEKVYLMSIGKIQMRAPKAPPAPAASAAPPSPIVGRRIVSNNPAPAGNSNGAAPKPSPSASLSDQEKIIARKMNCSEVDYAKYKGNPAINGPTAPK